MHFTEDIPTCRSPLDSKCCRRENSVAGFIRSDTTEYNITLYLFVVSTLQPLK